MKRYTLDGIQDNSAITELMSTAMHSATAEDIGDTDELSYWDSLTLTLRKMTLTAFKAVLKTYNDTLYVALLGAQTIAGVKTFSSSPIVPTPTATGQAANIDYVDSKPYFAVSQTYQDMTASRALTTTYTNSTGKAIVVSVRCNNGGASGYVAITVGGVEVFHTGTYANDGGGAIAIAPIGATYSVTSNSALVKWMELR